MAFASCPGETLLMESVGSEGRTSFVCELLRRGLTGCRVGVLYQAKVAARALHHKEAFLLFSRPGIGFLGRL